MTVNAITDTKKGRTGIAPTYLHTTRNRDIFGIIKTYQLFTLIWCYKGSCGLATFKQMFASCGLATFKQMFARCRPMQCPWWVTWGVAIVILMSKTFWMLWNHCTRVLRLSETNACRGLGRFQDPKTAQPSRDGWAVSGSWKRPWPISRSPQILKTRATISLLAMCPVAVL